jgi:hypothetical protein
MSGFTNAGGRVGRYKRLFALAGRWNVVRFLACGGTMLVILGLTGVLGLLGSLSRASLFNPPYWINWFHLLFGAFVLAVAVTGNKRLQFGLALLAALAGTMLGLVGLAFGPHAAAHNGMLRLPDTSDPLAHLAVGVLAILALRNSKCEGSAA